MYFLLAISKLRLNNLFILFILISYLHFGLSANEQNTKTIDSLLSGLKNGRNDSTSIFILVKQADSMESLSIKSIGKTTTNEYLQLANTLAIDSGLINSLSYEIDRIGVKYRNNGNYIAALKFHNWADDIANRIANKNLNSIIYNNIGVVYRRLDDYQTALSNHIKALQLAEETRNIKSQAIAINSIGNIQMMIGNYDESLEYFKQSLILEQKLNNLLGIAINLNNIGNVYATKEEYPKAIEYFNLSLDVNKEIKSQRGIAICYNDIGNVFETLGQLDEALQYYLDAFNINKKINDKYNKAYSYLQVGKLYIRLNHNQRAYEYLITGLDIAKSIGVKAFIMEFYTALYKINRAQKNYEKAFNYLELSHSYHDSINNINLRKEVARLQIKFESEQKESHIASLEQNAEFAELDIKRQKFITILILSAFIIALGFVISLSYYLFNKNKTNKLLLERNSLIEKTKAELDSYSKQLLIAKQEAERNSKTKSEFLANMSHEIRTPLNSVIGFADLLSESVNDPQQLNHLKVIKSSGKTLLTLINDILDLSKIEAGKLTIEYEKINPEFIIEDITQIFYHRSFEKNIELKTTISPDLPDTILFSELRLRQILFNIVGNSIKFTHSGSINIDVLTQATDSIDEIDMVINITDTGIGIKETEFQNIFEPFNQSNTSTNTQGTGLGLAITKRLVEMMNGTIHMVSQEGVGTKFSIHFPQIKTIETESDSLNNSTQTFANTKFIKILVLANTPYDCKALNISGIKNLNKDIVYNLEDAKSHLLDKNIVIICGYSEDESIEALITLGQKNKHTNVVYIVITNKVFEYGDKNVVFFDMASSQKEMARSLVSIFKKISFDKKSSYYFQEILSSSSSSIFISDITHVFNNNFKIAYTTKMSSNILEFMTRLRIIAEKHEANGLMSYCDDLEATINNFEIEEIDNLLNLFNINYQLINE